ncbi:MAG: hypothetical protein COV36_02035 [Alphaproteobacteria bacterium CG11_big_fil_rev_8_21_14_0_20_44_7]|nr:MAG: hypothetical protein COV36_02035 [Alphaproteobacteria bacterium CG11_big_fil_rev_8_21_14_0_20_44_7]
MGDVAYYLGEEANLRTMSAQDLKQALASEIIGKFETIHALKEGGFGEYVYRLSRSLGFNNHNNIGAVANAVVKTNTASHKIMVSPAFLVLYNGYGKENRDDYLLPFGLEGVNIVTENALRREFGKYFRKFGDIREAEGVAGNLPYLFALERLNQASEKVGKLRGDHGEVEEKIREIAGMAVVLWRDELTMLNEVLTKAVADAKSEFNQIEHRVQINETRLLKKIPYMDAVDTRGYEGIKQLVERDVSMHRLETADSLMQAVMGEGYQDSQLSLVEHMEDDLQALEVAKTHADSVCELLQQLTDVKDRAFANAPYEDELTKLAAKLDEARDSVRAQKADALERC